MRYKVIWFDDEHGKPLLDHIPKTAYREGIDLVGFASAEAGIRELERAADQYHAVLLDGLFYDTEDQSGDSMDETALNTVLLYLQRITDRRKLNAFILSGQRTITTKGNQILKVHKIDRVYDKSVESDYHRLWKDIRSAAGDLPDAQLLHRHVRVFEVCTERYIGAAAGKELLAILKHEQEASITSGTDTYIVALRKILEDLFAACNRLGIVPAAFMPASGALNETGAFLAGRVSRNYQIRTDVVPKVVGELISNILAYAQPAAHRGQVDEHLKLVQSPYLLHGLTYLLMDVLLWFKGFADAPPTGPLFEKVTHNSITEPLYTGPLERDEARNFHCGEYCFAPAMLSDGFEIGDIIAITVAEDNNHPRNSHLYPKFAKRFHKA